MSDILYKSAGGVFSYRVAAVIVKNGRALLQKPTNDTGYAFIGGHVEFGETGEATLRREFLEELGADIRVGELMWTGEIFFPWGDGRPCHQLCLFYEAELSDDANIPMEGVFTGTERLEGRKFTMEFHWVELEKLRGVELYPTDAKELLLNGIKNAHFVYSE